jgi:protein-S-isoprenylcysteine O-methyltransferase Ste14
MRLRRELEQQGAWLFQHRGTLPLLLLLALVPALWAAPQVGFPFGAIGQHVYRGLCIGVGFAGLLVRILTVGCVPGSSSGRNTGGQVASALNTTGAYSLLRHPLYFGNVLTYLAIVCYPGVWWAGLLAVLLLVLYYERIILAEEAFLREQFGEEFRAWAARTPAFFPRWRHWRRPALPFCLRTAARREYSGLFAIVLAFALLQQGLDDIEQRDFVLNRVWALLLAAAALVYLTLRTLKRHSRLLHVPGR